MLTAIRTYTGRDFDFQTATVSDIDIEDIAHALSMLNRFTGHTPLGPISVAQHSVLCAQYAPAGFKLEALLHDAHEAYCNDLPTPLKQLLPDYCAIERRIEGLVREAFKLPATMSHEVHEVDRRMLVTEAKACCFGWWKELGIQPYPVHTMGSWSWHMAKQAFLATFEEHKGA